MRVLLDQSEHSMRNKGNNALLESAMDRLAGYWPNASFDILTLAPQLTRTYYPTLSPVSPTDLQQIQGRFATVRQFVPQVVSQLLLEIREELWHRRTRRRLPSPPSVNAGEASTSEHLRNGNEIDATIAEEEDVQTSRERKRLEDALSVYDLIVAVGGGYMCDHDKQPLLDVFDRLEAAQKMGVPTVMVGQGVGPLTDPELWARAKQVLPAVDLIFYRNQRLGRPILDALGVSVERIVMTGDDAIEMAYTARPAVLGRDIGVSLRVSAYTQVEQSNIALIRTILHQAARTRWANLVALPISSAAHESDITYIRQLLAGYDSKSIGWRKLDNPLATVKQTARCRLVITGTYHGAVFALAQGIPVVGVAKSAEYHNKLSELADEFGSGCQVFRVDDAHFSEKFASAIDDTWDSASTLRTELLTAAERQIAWRHAAYERIYSLVTQPKRHVARNQ